MHDVAVRSQALTARQTVHQLHRQRAIMITTHSLTSTTSPNHPARARLTRSGCDRIMASLDHLYTKFQPGEEESIHVRHRISGIGVVVEADHSRVMTINSHTLHLSEGSEEATDVIHLNGSRQVGDMHLLIYILGW